jgi:hypothetical protein
VILVDLPGSDPVARRVGPSSPSRSRRRRVFAGSHRNANWGDGDKVEAYPPGSVVVLPGNTSHFHWAKSGEYITQVTAIGITWISATILVSLIADNWTNTLGVRLLPTSDNGTSRKCSPTHLRAAYGNKADSCGFPLG